MWILISWLRQKPADLDIQFLQKMINPGSAGQGLILMRLPRGETMFSSQSYVCFNSIID